MSETERAREALERQYADGSARSPEAQEWLDNAQEIRVTKRPQDPEWPVLTFVEAMGAAASMLDGEAPTTAERLRKGVNYLLNLTAKHERLWTAEMARRIGADARAALGATAQPEDVRKAITWLENEIREAESDMPKHSDDSGDLEWCRQRAENAKAALRIVLGTPSLPVAPSEGQR